MIGIYSITNKVNGKRYVGQSVDILRRWRNHRASIDDTETYEYPLYRAIRKCGLDNFKFEVLEECLVEELNDKETYYIDKFDTFHSRQGYNQTIGGNNSTFQKLDLDKVEEITDLLKNTDLEGGEIAEKYGVSGNMISGINTGRFHKRDIDYPIRQTVSMCIDCGQRVDSKATRCVECHLLSRRTVERPPAEQLLEEVALKGFAATGRKYGVSDNAIRKWMTGYNLPTKTPEVKKLYGNHKPKPTPIEQVRHSDFILIKGDVEKPFASTREAANWLIENNYTSANTNSVISSVGRVITGKRNSYLGFKIK